MKRWNVFPIGTIKTPVKVFADNPYDAIMRAAAELCMTPREFRNVEEDVHFNVHGEEPS